MLVNVSLIIILCDISVTYDCIREIMLSNQETFLYLNALVAYFKFLKVQKDCRIVVLKKDVLC